jgi:hypothetical protein
VADEKRGASLAAERGLLKRGAAIFRSAARKPPGRLIASFLYPQKLCISLWTSTFFKGHFSAEIAFLLHWLIIDQPICP